MKAVLALALLALLTTNIGGSNILVLLPLPLYSHTHTFLPVFKELASRGHNVTMVYPYPQKESIPNWNEIIINGTVTGNMIGAAVKSILGISPYKFYSHALILLSDWMEQVFQDETLQSLIMADHLQFDLVVVEAFFSTEPLVAFGHKLNVPVVSLNPLSPTPWVSYITGNEVSLSLMPSFRTEHTNEMTFMERIENTLINFIEIITYYFYYIPRQESLMKKYMNYPGSEARPSLLSMLQDISLTLFDYHISVGYAEPLQPNEIPVGGLTISTSGQLPKLQDIMEASKSGVIYVSFGSFLGNDHVPKEWLEALLEVMAKLDQTVLLKWNSEIPKAPKNVIVRKWYPQSSVLAHPNLKLFITHSGLHSITEAAYYGVPLVCMPFFADQLYNSRMVEKDGYGLLVRKENRTSQSIHWAITTVLNDPRFKQKALERSKIVKDRPQTALESAIYWIEYVLRHNGAKHLRPARARLNLYQALSLDVAAFFVVLISLFLFIICKSIRIICRTVCSTSAKVKKE